MSQSESRPKRERKPTKTFDPEELSGSGTKVAKPRAKRSRKEPFPFEKLPDQVKTRIVSFLKAGGLCSSATVSKEWKKLTEENSTWGNVLLERFGHIFDDPRAGEDDSYETIIANWPTKKPFKEVYRDIYALENEKQAFWAQWASPKGSTTAANIVSGTCPMCEGPLYLEKNDMPKREEDEDPPSEKIIQCKTPKCGFVLPYATCATCKEPCNMVSTFICGGEKCSKLSIPEKIHCWECAKDCESGAPPDRCDGWLCPTCTSEVETKKGGKAYSCPLCCFGCVTCNKKFFNSEKQVCKKCKKVQCSKCAKEPGCGCAPSKSRRKAKPVSEDEDSEFDEQEAGSEEEDFEEEDASD
jgi:hypothetical protein